MYIINFFLVLVFITQQIYEGISLKVNSKLIFDSNKTIIINGKKYNELSCGSSNPEFSKLCTNITRIICSVQINLKSPKLIAESCWVINRDSIFFNSTVINETIIFEGKELLKSHWKLNFSPKITLTLAKKLVIDSNGTIINQFSNDNLVIVSMVFVIVLFSIFLAFFIFTIYQCITKNYCLCIKSKHIISENSRQISFANYPTSMTGTNFTNQLGINSEFNQINQTNRYSAFNLTYDSTSLKNAEFIDSTPKYDITKFKLDSEYAEPPSYSSLVNQNEGNAYDSAKASKI